MTKPKQLTACPCCGQALDHPVRLADLGPMLSPMEQSLFNLMKKCPDGIGSADIRDRLYPLTRDGNLPHPHTVAVVANHANKKLAAWGLKIEAGRGRHAAYRLVQI